MLKRSLPLWVAVGVGAAALVAIPIATGQNAWELQFWEIPRAAAVGPSSLGAISPGGVAAAGTTWIEVNQQAVRAIWVWTESGGFSFAQKTPYDAASTGAMFEVKAVSDTGVVAGHDGFGPAGSLSPPQPIIAWKWSQTIGFVRLADLAGGNGETAVFSISADGSTILAGR